MTGNLISLKDSEWRALKEKPPIYSQDLVSGNLYMYCRMIYSQSYKSPFSENMILGASVVMYVKKELWESQTRQRFWNYWFLNGEEMFKVHKDTIPDYIFHLPPSASAADYHE